MRKGWICLISTLALLALLALGGCGGGATFVEPVPTRVSLEVEGGSIDNVTMIVTRKGSAPNTTGQSQCTLESQPDWCNRAFQELRFDVQPSQTLYRVYVANNGAQSIQARVRLEKEGADKRAFATVPAGQSRWFWEIGIETAEVKNAVETD